MWKLIAWFRTACGPQEEKREEQVNANENTSSDQIQGEKRPAAPSVPADRAEALALLPGGHGK